MRGVIDEGTGDGDDLGADNGDLSGSGFMAEQDDDASATGD